MDNRKIDELKQLASQLNKLVNEYPLNLVINIPTIQALSKSILEKLNDQN